MYVNIILKCQKNHPKPLKIRGFSHIFQFHFSENYGMI